MALPTQPPPDAWAITVYFAPASAQAGHHARQAARLAGMLLRRASLARSTRAVYLAQIVDPAGTIRTVEAEPIEPGIELEGDG